MEGVAAVGSGAVEPICVSNHVATRGNGTDRERTNSGKRPAIAMRAERIEQTISQHPVPSDAKPPHDTIRFDASEPKKPNHK